MLSFGFTWTCVIALKIGFNEKNRDLKSQFYKGSENFVVDFHESIISPTK